MTTLPEQTQAAPSRTADNSVAPQVQVARQSLATLLLNPYMLLILILCLFAVVVMFYDPKGIVVALFVMPICAGLRLGYTTRQAIRMQAEALYAQTRALQKNTDLLKLSLMRHEAAAPTVTVPFMDTGE